MSSDRPVPCAQAVPARVRPARTAKTRVIKRIRKHSSETMEPVGALRASILHRRAPRGSKYFAPAWLSPIEHHESTLGDGPFRGLAGAPRLAAVHVDLEEVDAVGERLPLVVEAVPGELGLEIGRAHV